MSVAMADAVDDATYALCDNCADVYAMRDRWQRHCPECCAQLDDHRDGRHDTNPIGMCRDCDDDVAVYIELPAIA